MIVVAVQVALGIPLALFAVLLVAKPKFAWAWFSGRAIDRQRHTNATWLMPARGDRPVLHPSGHAIRWHHWPRIWRAGIRTGGTLAVYVTYAGLILAPLITGLAVAVLALACLGWLTWRAIRWLAHWKHWRKWGRPTHRALAKKMGAPPARLEISHDRSNVVIGLPEEFVPGDRDKNEIANVVITKLALESPVVDWSKLHGKRPEVAFRPCEQPPPSDVSWDDVQAAVMSAPSNTLVFGVGKKKAIIRATYSEAAHVAIPGSSGGGKSNLAAFLLLQEMLRGSLIVNLDPKWISHLWMQGLPNVINAHAIPELHMALAWLGRELDRRTRAAHASANGTGRVHGSVGPRIVVVAEELNFGMPGLKNHWHETRSKEDPKKSPALQALSDLSCAGRASDMHEYLIAQMLTADSTGAKDSTIRGNAGIKAMIRPDAPGWNMVVGKHIPLPPQSTAPGRIQLVTGQTVRETQVPYLHLDDKDEAVADEAVKWARALAISGTVAQIPTGPEGVPLQLWPAPVADGVLGDPDFSRPSIPAGQGPVPTGNDPITPARPDPLKLSEIVDLGLVPGMTLDALRKASLRWDDFPEVDGHEGPANTYNPDEVVECVQSHRQALRVVS